MTTLNSYATLAEYRAYATARGQVVETVVADDVVIEDLLKTASRHIETKTGRRFVPYIETRYYDVPKVGSLDSRLLQLDEDLLEVITLTNGDGVVIPSTEYSLRPRNESPHYGIRLIDNSSYYWASDGAGDTHDVIAVEGVWGFHNRYSQAWLLGSTANEALDASETGYDVTSNTAFVIGDLVRFDNELGYVSALPANGLTITRGENYSTAATHLTAINIYIWQVMTEAKNAVCEITRNAYDRRFGQSNSGVATITAAGVVLSPKEIPAMATEFIATYRDVL